MSAFCQSTDFDHGGASGEDVTADQDGSPERLMEVTVQPRPTATLHIRVPGRRLMKGALFFLLLGCAGARTEESVTSADYDLLRHEGHAT